MKTHNFRLGLIIPFLVVIFLVSLNLNAQDATLGFPIASFTSTTVNSGAGNEVVFSHTGAAFSSATYTNCAAGASGNTMRIDNNTDYFDVTSPNGTLNRVDVTIQSNGTSAANAIIGFSADGTTWSNFQELAAPANNANPSCTNHSISPPAGMKYFRMMRTGFGGYTPSGATGVTYRVFVVSAWVTAVATPTLTVSATPLSGFTYISGAGPSANQTYNVAGTNLTAGAITVTAPANYEVSTAAGGPYGATATIANAAGGTLAATPIYVRLKAGLSVGLYNAQTITMTGGGVATPPSVTLNGSVTSGVLTPLAAPVPAAPSAATSSGFTANWATVANATGGYEVHVYDGATLVKTVAVAGQASTNVAVTGLNSSTSYTYKMVAIGDGLSYSNSVESAASASITTSAVVMTPSSCQLPKYSTDFSDWTAMDQRSAGSSDPFVLATGGGAGFTISAKPLVDPTGTSGTAGTNVPFISFDNSTGTAITFPPINFICGGVVKLKINHNPSGSNRNILLNYGGSSAGITAVVDAVPVGITAQPQISGVTATVGTTYTGNDFKTGKGGTSGMYEVTFMLPSSVTGSQVLNLTGGSLKDIQITSMQVCTSICSQVIVASTDYANCTADPEGMSFSGIKGAVVPVAKTLNVKGWNITGPVTLSIIGADAGRFSLPSSTLAIGPATAGAPVTVNFMPSVVTGVSSAQLVISSAGAPDYCVSLTGLTTSSAAPEITTPNSTISLTASLIQEVSTEVDITGVNLTGNVTLALSGAGASQYRLSTTSVTKANASGTGQTVTLYYVGGTTAPLTHNATLTLSSPGATSIAIPLVGKTLSYPPVMYTLTTIASPSGSGVVSTNIAGPEYASGTVLTISAIAQTGYKFVRWSDITSYSPNRIITMNSNKTITAIFAPSSNGSGAVGTIEAYNASAITTTGFTASWSAVAGATSYTIKVYDGTTEVKSLTTAGTSIAVTALTQNKAYTYQVTSNNGEVTELSGPYKLTPDPALLPACGN